MKQSDGLSIEALFKAARESEQVLDDEPFTSAVINRISAEPLSSSRYVPLAGSQLLPDSQISHGLSFLLVLLATVLGAFICYTMVPLEQWLTAALWQLDSLNSLVTLVLSGMVLAFVSSMLLAYDHL